MPEPSFSTIQAALQTDKARDFWRDREQGRSDLLAIASHCGIDSAVEAAERIADPERVQQPIAAAFGRSPMERLTEIQRQQLSEAKRQKELAEEHLRRVKKSRELARNRGWRSRLASFFAHIFKK